MTAAAELADLQEWALSTSFDDAESDDNDYEPSVDGIDGSPLGLSRFLSQESLHPDMNIHEQDVGFTEWDVSFADLVDEVGCQERLRALKYFLAIEKEDDAACTKTEKDHEGRTRLQQINRAIVELQQKCHDRFSNSRPRRWIADLMSLNEKAVKKSNEKLAGAKNEVKAKARRAKARIKASYEKVNDSVKGRVRKLITGDRDQKVRVYLQQPAVIRYTDRMCFCISVLCMMITQALLLTRPHLMAPWYVFLVVTMMTNRFFQYKSLKYHLFLIDFCYFVQCLALLNILWAPNSKLLTDVVFAFANGPLAWAVLTWRNSLVFHDVDKVTSTFIHLFPPLLTFSMRWHPICWPTGEMPSACVNSMHTASEFRLVQEGLLFPAGVYVVWQIGYLVLTEGLLRRYIYDDPDMQTSLRWLATDSRGGMYQLVTGACKSIGVMVPGEVLDPTAFKTKMIFVTSQMIYTICTLIPTTLLHAYYPLHVLWLCFLFTVCVWNGGSFYIEVFSRRYQKAAFPENAAKNE